jgi:hypothetical protein
MRGLFFSNAFTTLDPGLNASPWRKDHGLSACSLLLPVAEQVIDSFKNFLSR